MNDLQKEFEATGYTSWINSDLYPDGKIYTQEYTQWLERRVQALSIPDVVGRSEQLPCQCCGGKRNDDGVCINENCSVHPL